MKLFVLRHGQAEARAATDAQRQLTSSGRNDLAKVLANSRSELTVVDELWVSPLTRTQQTAEIVLDVLARPVPCRTTEVVIPEAGLTELYAALQTFDKNGLMLISHMPLVGELISDLCGADSGYYTLGTSTLACIQLDIAASGLGELLWLRHP